LQDRFVREQARPFLHEDFLGTYILCNNHSIPADHVYHEVVSQLQCVSETREYFDENQAFYRT